MKILQKWIFVCLYIRLSPFINKSIDYEILYFVDKMGIFYTCNEIFYMTFRILYTKFNKQLCFFRSLNL